jgi:hypothetical protein
MFMKVAQSSIEGRTNVQPEDPAFAFDVTQLRLGYVRQQPTATVVQTSRSSPPYLFFVSARVEGVPGELVVYRQNAYFDNEPSCFPAAAKGERGALSPLTMQCWACAALWDGTAGAQHAPQQLSATARAVAPALPLPRASRPRLPPPSSPPVLLPSGDRRRMDQLAIGDTVLALDAATGAPSFQEIYFFGHQDATAEAAFLRLHLAGGASLTLTPDHFVPLLKGGAGWRGHVMARAGDVAPGDSLLVHSEGEAEGGGGAGPVAAVVVAVEVVLERGLYNPYTLGGLIVVDGVVASAHSSWVLDAAFDALGQTRHLPAAYQLLFAPLRALYRLGGPSLWARVAPLLIHVGNSMVGTALLPRAAQALGAVAATLAGFCLCSAHLVSLPPRSSLA